MTELDSGAVTTSPFERIASSPARRVLRIAIPLIVVAASIMAAVLLTRPRPDAATATGHNHVAPAGGVNNAVPVALDAEAARRIGVTFAAVTTGRMTTDVRLVGLVTADETRTTAIAPRVEGWIEKLHVNFTGQDVHEGEPLLDIYSPMVVAAQEELLLAARLVRDVTGGTEEARRSAEEMLVSARRRLQYWDIPAVDVERIERTGQSTRTVTLRAASRGIVVDKLVVNGQRVMAGETLFRLADLRTVWLEGQVFEDDLAKVRLGQRVTVEIQAFPGESWAGSVTYIYPIVDPDTRTARIRVELPNPALRLKPGMFATVHLTVTLREHALRVPRTAVLATGQRSLVFVRIAGGMLEPREVVVGTASHDHVEIRSGLQAGDTVVASATFLVDAESNLQSALANMAGMPGMEVTPSRPVDPGGVPDMKAEPSKKVPPAEDHSSHGMADTVATRKNPIRREE